MSTAKERIEELTEKVCEESLFCFYHLSALCDIVRYNSDSDKEEFKGSMRYYMLGSEGTARYDEMYSHFVKARNLAERCTWAMIRFCFPAVSENLGTWENPNVLALSFEDDSAADFIEDIKKNELTGPDRNGQHLASLEGNAVVGLMRVAHLCEKGMGLPADEWLDLGPFGAGTLQAASFLARRALDEMAIALNNSRDEIERVTRTGRFASTGVTYAPDSVFMAKCFGDDPLKTYKTLLDDVEKMARFVEARRRREAEIQSSRKSGCYIATCVYGSYDCPEVWALRRFRDQFLAKRGWGRAFIRAYYAVSPGLVARFGGVSWLKSVARRCLDKVVAACREGGYKDTPYTDQ